MTEDQDDIGGEEGSDICFSGTFRVRHQIDEQIHHGAEIGVLGDLDAVRVL